MEDVSFIEFFRSSLHLPADWSVEGVRKDDTQQRIYVNVAYRGSQTIYDHQPERQWRHLDVCQYQTFIVARLPRVHSSSGSIDVVPAPWASPKQRTTIEFECHVLDVVLDVKNRLAASRLLKMHYTSVLRLCARATLRGLARRTATEAVAPSCVRYLGIDEKCYAWPRRMATIVTDTERQCVLAVVDGHSQASAEQALTTALLPVQRTHLHAISMDLWDPFITATKRVLPETAIVHDKYHLEQMNQKAIDQTRRHEVHQHPELKGKRFWLLRRTATRPPKHDAFFEAIHKANMVTAVTWQAAEDFRAVYRLTERTEARDYLLTWVQRYCITRIVPLRRLVDTFEAYLEGIINYFDHRITNALAERINGKIQEIKLLAKGFRTFENFRAAVLFYLGKLDLYPQISV